MDRDANRMVEFEDRLRETALGSVPNSVSLSYTEPFYGDGGFLNALIVSNRLDKGVQKLRRIIGESEVDLLVVDRELFESDVTNSKLFEVAAGRLLYPYVALMGEDYLTLWDGLYKQRKIRESLTTLALEHLDLSSELLIDPRYFVHDILLKLTHILPQTSRLLQSLDYEGYALTKGYVGALKELEREGAIRFKGEFIAVEKGFVDSVQSQGPSMSDQLVQVQTQLNALIKLGPSGVVDLIRSLPRFSIEDLLPTALGSTDLPKPRRFLNFPTASGLAPLSESTNIDEMLVKLEAPALVGGTRLQRLGRVLNEVYLLTYTADGGERRAIVKRYPNWVSLKWAPIAIWTLGTQNFAVLGRSRMERECATTSLLHSNEIKVPRILHTSFEDRLLLREYVEGESPVETIRAVMKRGSIRNDEGVLIRRLGGMVADVHGAGVTLGDCKPENFIVKDGGDIVIIDLEQGARGGNETWDLAEFLYFSGRYAGPLDPMTGVAEMTRLFIDGYVEGGGSRHRFSEVGQLRYTKVFTPLTLLPVIYTIAKTCRIEGH